MITFGRFGHKKDKEKDQKLFLESLNNLLDDFKDLFRSENSSNLSEKELIAPLKKIIKRNSKSSDKSNYELCLSFFLEKMGLTYYTLTLK